MCGRSFDSAFEEQLNKMLLNSMLKANTAQDALNLVWWVGSVLVKEAKNQTDALEQFGGKGVEETHLKV